MNSDNNSKFLLMEKIIFSRNFFKKKSKSEIQVETQYQSYYDEYTNKNPQTVFISKLHISLKVTFYEKFPL